MPIIIVQQSLFVTRTSEMRLRGARVGAVCMMRKNSHSNHATLLAPVPGALCRPATALCTPIPCYWNGKGPRTPGMMMHRSWDGVGTYRMYDAVARKTPRRVNVTQQSRPARCGTQQTCVLYEAAVMVDEWHRRHVSCVSQQTVSAPHPCWAFPVDPPSLCTHMSSVSQRLSVMPRECEDIPAVIACHHICPSYFYSQMYACMYTYIFIYICMFIYICIFIRVCIYVLGARGA